MWKGGGNWLGRTQNDFAQHTQRFDEQFHNGYIQP